MISSSILKKNIKILFYIYQQHFCLKNKQTEIHFRTFDFIASITLHTFLIRKVRNAIVSVGNIIFMPTLE